MNESAGMTGLHKLPVSPVKMESKFSVHVFALFLFILLASGFSATEKEVKLSGKYFFGEGGGENEDIAKKSAVRDLMFKINVTVTAEDQSVKRETESSYQEDFKSAVKSVPA